MARDEYIRIYRSSTPGAEPSLTSGEIAANLVDNKLFIGGTNGSLITFYANGTTGIITPGPGIDVIRTTPNDVRIDNIGVITFNGIAGGASLTGDGGAVQGKVGDRISVRNATYSLTGVASFNSSYFTVANGAVSLSGAHQVTADRISAGTNVTITRVGPSEIQIASSSASLVNGVTGIGFGNDLGLTGKINLTAGPNSGISITGAVNGDGVCQVTITNTGVTSFNGLAGTVTLTGDGQAILGRDNNTISVRLASTSVTGVASFNSSYFDVINGAVSTKSITINDSVGGIGAFTLGNSYSFIGKSISTTWLGGSNLEFANLGVTSFNGLAGTVTLTGDSGAVLGKGNNRISVREASDSVTGVASFNPSYFTVSNGAVSLISGYQVTGDTVQAGHGIVIRSSNSTKTIFNTGVTSFNGLTGNVTLTGDGGAVQGKGNDRISVREASTSVTGVASFNPSYFTVSNGAVSLISGYQVTGDTVVAGTNVTISRNGNTVTVNSSSASSTTIVNGVTGIGFGNDLGLTGKINLTAGSGISITGAVNGDGVCQVTITNTGVTSFNGLAGIVTLTGDGQALLGRDNNTISVREASTSVTGVASFNSSYFTVSNGAVSAKSITINDSVGGVGTFTLGDSRTFIGKSISTTWLGGSNLEFANLGVTSFNGLAGTVTLTGDGGAVQGKGNNRILVREASTSVTGVASFNSSYFDVTNGAVSLKSGYQVTGDTVVAGTNVTISRNGNTVTVNSNSASSTTIVNGVTGIGFGNDLGLTGKINLTAGSGISITGAVNGDGVCQVTITNTGVTSFNGLAGTVTLTGDGGAVQGKGNDRISVREASTSVTGVASFNSSYFDVINGAVSTKSITINDSVGGVGAFTLGNSYSFIGKSISTTWLGGSNLEFANLGVTSFNGLAGTVTLTGDGQAILGKGNNRISVREASTSVTGVASFNSSYFDVTNGAVSLKTGYQVTGDTVVAGHGIVIRSSNSTKTIFNTGVTSFNGLTGNVTLTGDGQAILGRDNNKISARVPTACGITGVLGLLCSGGLIVNNDGLISLDGGGPPPPGGCAPDCSVYDGNEAFCIQNGCSYCRDSGACVCDTSTSICLGGWQTLNAKFSQLNTGLGVSGTSAGIISYIYLDVGNLATMGSTIESTDSVLFFDANEPGLIKTKKASISKLLLDNDNLFESKTPSQLTRNTKSSTIEFSVVLGDVAAGSQGLLKGASAHYYIAQNTVRSLNGMTGDLEFMINGCTGGGSGKITITGTVNEVTVSTACPTIVIGLPDNVMVPYISISGGTFTETVSANLFIGSIAGGTF